MERHTYRQLPYRLLCPLAVEPGTRYPLVIFLHGAGERGTDNEKQLTHGVPQFLTAENRTKFPCFLMAPQCPPEERWVEVDWGAESHVQPREPSEPARRTLELVDRAMRELPIDPDRVYLTGLSMGGFGTWDLLARRPDLFAAAAIVCGGADDAMAERIRHIPQWVFHGAKDDAVKPARSRRMVAALERVGGTPRYTEYPDVGHHSWVNAYSDPVLFAWLFAQRRPG